MRTTALALVIMLLLVPSGLVLASGAEADVSGSSENDFEATESESFDQENLSAADEFDFDTINNEEITLELATEKMFMGLGESPFAPEGSGTFDDPLLVYDAGQLAYIASQVNSGELAGAYIELMGNIDLSDYGPDFDSGAGWIPIGENLNPFSSHFNGNGYTIAGLYINRPNTQNIGLFGYLDGATIKNLHVTNAEVTGWADVGGIAGRMFSTSIENCSASAAVSGLYRAGGIVGSVLKGSSVTNCIAVGRVDGLEWYANDIGGIAGSVNVAEGYVGVANSAALNQSISGLSGIGRVAGYSSPGSLDGNIAWEGMEVSGSKITDGTASDLHGEGKTAEELQSIDAFPEGFHESPWVYVPGSLPGLGAPIPMPSYLESETGSDDGEDPNIVSCEADLITWLETNTGTVYLGDNIEINQDICIREGPITIDTGKFGLIYNSGYLNPQSSDVEIWLTGEGVDTPVLEILDIADNNSLISSEEERNYYISLLNITATGRGGDGGTAVRIHATGHDDFIFFWTYTDTYKPGQIRSSGNGAIGVELMDYFNLYAADIEVTGDNSTAVYAHKGAYIHLSRLSADGDGAMVIRGDGITADSCSLTSTPGPDVEVSRGSFIPDRMAVRQGIELYPFDVFINHSAARFANGSGEMEWASVVWDVELIRSIDTNTIGETIITGSPAWSWLADMLDGMPELIIDVRDRQIPCINNISRNLVGENNEVLSYSADFWIGDGCSMDDIILWYSDDDGNSWTDVTDKQGIELNYYSEPNGRFIVPIEMLADKESLFAIESLGVGASNVVRFSPDLPPNRLEDGGGDRSGTDRVGWSLWEGLAFVIGGGDTDGGDHSGSGDPSNGNTDSDNTGGSNTDIDNIGGGDNTGTNDPGGGNTDSNNTGDGDTGGGTNNPPDENPGNRDNNDLPVSNTGGDDSDNPPEGDSNGVSPDSGNPTSPVINTTETDESSFTLITTDKRELNSEIIGDIVEVFNPGIHIAALPEIATDEGFSSDSGIGEQDPIVAELDIADNDMPLHTPESQPDVKRPGAGPYAAAGAALTCAVFASGIMIRRVKLRGKRR